MRTMIILAACLALAACGGKKKQEGTEGSGSSTGSAMAGSDKSSGMAGSGSSMAGSGSDQGSAAGSGSGSGSSAAAGSGSAATDDGKPHMAGNCPSTVLGSETKAEVKGKDVVLTITSADKDAIAAIQKRTTELLKEKSDAPDPKGQHDQKGTQGGTKGICPVYWDEGGKATAKNDAKGVVITITPKGKVDELKKTIDERILKAADFVKAKITPGSDKNQGGVGGATGPEGANHTGKGDGKGKERKGSGDGGGGGAGTGGGGGKGTGGGSGKGTGGGSGKGSGK